MPGEKSAVNIGEIEITSEKKLTEREAYSIQEFSLGSEKDPTATIRLNLDSGFYTVHWTTDSPQDYLVDLIEECLADCENRYPNGIEALDARVIDLLDKDIKESDSAYPVGVVFICKVKEGSDRNETPSYQRPLTWQQCVEPARDKEVSFLKINTPIGHFSINTQIKKNNFGIFSSIEPSGGFINMMEKSTNGKITAAKALELFNEACLSFGRYPVGSNFTQARAAR